MNMKSQNLPEASPNSTNGFTVFPKTFIVFAQEEVTPVAVVHALRESAHDVHEKKHYKWCDCKSEILCIHISRG